MESIGFGIIGLGAIAALHVKALEDLTEATFVAGFDILPGRAQEFCKVHGGRPYSDLEAFLDDPDVQVVTIATPSGLHLENALSVCRKGKHLIVEKPLEINSERCKTIVDAAQEAGVSLSVIFPTRTFEISRLIHDAISRGRFGKIVSADAFVNWYRSQEYYDAGTWRGTWALDGGGALMNQSIHAIDLLLWFVGDVQEVYSFMDTRTHTGIEVEDVAVACLRFKNGALGLIQGTTSAYPGFPKRIEIYGSEGSVIMEEDSLISWDFKVREPADEGILSTYGKASATAGGAQDPMAISHLGHQALFLSCIESLRRRGKVTVDGTEGSRAVTLIEAIYKSAREKRAVQLP